MSRATPSPLLRFDPKPWVDLSPTFSLKDIGTATLVEAGERSLVTFEIDFAAALWRMGVPHEFVSYPLEGHNLMFPRAQWESAERNLDWFNYWLFHERDRGPSKQAQYSRWERMSRDMAWMRAHNAQATMQQKQ
jgi:hypothetical protein